MDDRERRLACGRLLCELLPIVVVWTSVPVHPRHESAPIAHYIASARPLNPFDSDNLPEDPPPAPRRVSLMTEAITTTGSPNVVDRFTRWY